MRPGDAAPEFSLPATDGSRHGVSGGPAAVVFTCNHCPYALAWHERIQAVVRDYADRVPVLQVCANDADRYPRDSFAAMRERVEAEGGWPGPYLHDADQSVARSYGAQTTPDVFVVDATGRLAYRGAPDGDYDDPGQGAALLRDALDAVLDGRAPDPAETPPVGCSIKWRPG